MGKYVIGWLLGFCIYVYRGRPLAPSHRMGFPAYQDKHLTGDLVMKHLSRIFTAFFLSLLLLNTFANQHE